MHPPNDLRDHTIVLPAHDEIQWIQRSWELSCIVVATLLLAGGTARLALAAPERVAIDKNFAVHLPLLDRMFGTYYLPDHWPESYGLSGGEQVPEGYGSQFVHPLRRRTS